MNEGRAMLDPPATPLAKRLYTYDELVAEFPETNQPCELWDGEIVIPPAPGFDHQKIVSRLLRRLEDWVLARKLGEVVAGPIDMVLSLHRAIQRAVGVHATAT